VNAFDWRLIEWTRTQRWESSSTAHRARFPAKYSLGFLLNEHAFGAADEDVAQWDPSRYLGIVKLAEIEQKALALPERDRARLAARLLETLPPPGMDVPDEEIDKRERELESGQVEAISHEEFTRRVQKNRGG